MQGENKLGEKIASLRRSRGLTQAELAEKLNFTHQAVSNWERCVSESDTSTLIRLSGYFGVTADELLGTEDGQPAEPVPPARDAVRISPARARNDASDTLTQYFRQSDEETGAAQTYAAARGAKGDAERRERSLIAALIVYSVCTAVAALFSLFGNSPGVRIVYVLAGVCAVGADIAAAVLLFIVKRPPRFAFARIPFLAGIAVSEGGGIALLFAESGDAVFALGLTVLAAGILRVYGAPFAFRADDKPFLIGYFIFVTAMIGCSALSFAFAGLGAEAVFAAFSRGLRIPAAWFLYCALETKPGTALKKS